MGTIYSTTMKPGKLELLTDWVPRQDYYLGSGAPRLDIVGGFRLDDPEGQVGMEFIFVANRAELKETVYHVPLTYRDAPLEGAEDSLLGTSEHGMLGTRYIYEASIDPTWQACVADLLAGTAQPQHQKLSDSPEPRVTVIGPGPIEGPVQIVRVLEPGEGEEREVLGIWRDPLSREQSGVVLRAK